MIGAVVTGLLFYAVQTLIEPDKVEPVCEPEGQPVELGKVREPKPPQEIERPIQRPPVTETPPPPKPDPSLDPSGGRDGFTSVQPPSVGTPSLDDMGRLSNEPIPIVRVAPQYPRRAATRGEEGYAVIEFTIATDGTLVNARIVDESGRDFGREALRAVRQWRYQLQRREGVAFARSGVRVRLDFKLTVE